MMNQRNNAIKREEAQRKELSKILGRPVIKGHKQKRTGLHTKTISQGRRAIEVILQKRSVTRHMVIAWNVRKTGLSTDCAYDSQKVKEYKRRV